MIKHYIPALFVLLFALPLQAGVVGKELTYQLDGQSFTGYFAYDDAISSPRPGVLVVHEWWGHNDYARHRAEMLAAQGYVALAVDMYGSGKLAEHPDDAKAFMTAVTQDMTLAVKRFQAARQLLHKQPQADASQTAAIGYCFGGGVVLHMLRTGEELAVVASYHGALDTQSPLQSAVASKVLVFNGADDPFIPAEQLQAFEQEMQAQSVDYELHNYPGVLHSFTNPGADAVGEKFQMPLRYDAQADQHSWQRTLEVFASVLTR